MKYNELIALCIELMASYNEKRVTPDSHAQIFLDSKKLTDNERNFLEEVFYNTHRYSAFLNAFTEALFRLYPSTTNRNDRFLFHIFVFILCFRFKELPLQQLKRMVLSVDAVKMNVLLELLFDIDKLEKEVRPAWVQTLDEKFIDETIIGGLCNNLEKVTQILGKISEKATGKKSDLVRSIEEMTGKNLELAEDNKREPTKIQPFNLTKPKAKLIPEPIKIPVDVVATPINKAIYKTSLQEMNLKAERRKQERKQEAARRVKEECKEPELKAKARPENLQKVRKEVEEARKKQMQRVEKTRPVPDFGEVDIKLNAAAILRQQELLKRQAEEEQRKLKEFEYNMRDESQFANWQQKMKRKDRQQFMEWQHKKKIEMELSKQAAIKAYNDKVAQNKKLAGQLKVQSKKLANQRDDKFKLQVQQKKKLIQDVQVGKEQIVVQRQKVLQRNRKIREQQVEQRKRVLEAKKLEDQVQNEKRKQLIRQIRQFERQPKERLRPYDPTQTTGAGLLDEMTLVQLKSRLQQIKQQRRKQQQQKRVKFNLEKAQQAEALQKKKEFVLSMREKRSKKMDQERRVKRQESQRKAKIEEQVRKQNQKGFQIKDAARRKQKREEQAQLKAELRQIQKKRQFLNANQAMVQANAWKSLEEGAERQIKERQVQKLIERQQFESVKHKENLIRVDQAKKEIREMVQFNKDYEGRMNEANRVNKLIELQRNETVARKYAEVREYELQHSKNMKLRNSFAQKSNERSLSKKKIQAEIPPSMLHS